MKANKTHISLETAKLLKDCKIESEYSFVVASDGARLLKSPVLDTYKYFDQYPAYTWQEILWENVEKFFSKKDVMKERNKKIGQPAIFFSGQEYKYHPIMILELLQQKKYQEADKYFAENSILLNH